MHDEKVSPTTFQQIGLPRRATPVFRRRRRFPALSPHRRFPSSHAAGLPLILLVRLIYRLPALHSLSGIARHGGRRGLDRLLKTRLPDGPSGSDYTQCQVHRHGTHQD